MENSTSLQKKSATPSHARGPRITICIDRRLEKKLKRLGKLEKRFVPRTFRKCLDAAITELQRKRTQHDNRTIKLA